MDFTNIANNNWSDKDGKATKHKTSCKGQRARQKLDESTAQKEYIGGCRS